MSAAFEQWLHDQWAERGVVACALWPLSLVYNAIRKARNEKITPEKLPVPVVVVGNIYVGGTGKTPVTIEIVRALVENGYKPGVISRGYGRKNDAPQMVSAESLASAVGDEPLLIYRATKRPVAVGRDRIAAGRLLLEQHPEVNVIISDDGLQHKRLARDVELVVVGARGMGNGWTFPAGPLREPPERMDDVDAIILNANTDPVATRTPRFAATRQLGAAFRLCSGERLPIDTLAARILEGGKKVLAAAGIAAPERFFVMLKAHDIEGEVLALGDHYDFSQNPFAKSAADVILVTGKDAVKCLQVPEIARDERVWCVDLEVELDPFFLRYLLDRLQELVRPA
ncbi:MAG: tetraacyldisaccharide 4'-kinase [Duodenibacillus sp.]|nr:tetraacyldisaccharide 4'-kinase [Duodenibacillus sp.]